MTPGRAGRTSRRRAVRSSDRTTWLLLDGAPAEAACAALAGAPSAVRAWPAHDEDDTPDAIVAPAGGAEPLGALGRRLGDPPVVAIVAAGDRDAARAALSEGADAVLGDDELERLPAAIAAARAGLVAVSPRFSPALERPPLTPREKQVLALVVMGFTNPEIATQLVVSVNTVKSHLKSAFRRLGVRTRSEAVALITDLDRGLGSGILTINR